MPIRWKPTVISMAAAVLLFGATYSHAQSDPHGHSSASSEHSSIFQIPKSMEVERAAIHSELVKLTQAGGRTGEAAPEKRMIKGGWAAAPMGVQ